MLLVFCMGVVFGAGIGWFFWWTARREVFRLDEQGQILAQEKFIVFEFVHNMVEAVGEGVSRQKLLDKVAHAAVLSTGALSACVFELQGDTLKGVAVEGLFPPSRRLPEHKQARMNTRTKFIEQVLRSEVFKMGEGLVGTVAQSGQGVLIENAQSDPRVLQHNDPSLQIKSLVMVPIRFRDKDLGVLAIANPSDGGSFGETDFSLATGLAEQAGLALHNLDLMETQIEKNRMDVDLGLAREIQSMLLPREFPQVAGLEMASIYQPAQKVGGDLYDVFQIDENRVGVAIADVAGKGVSASLVMAICQSNLRHFSKTIESPAALLNELNRVMLNELRPEMFVTVIYAVLDLSANELIFARGGHELPILVHAENGNTPEKVEFLGAEGMALGMVPEAIFSEAVKDCRIPFVKGDVLALYTDGVTEVVNREGVEFGNGRLADLLKTLRSRSAKEMTHGILDRVALFSGSAVQSDDFTVVIAKHL